MNDTPSSTRTVLAYTLFSTASGQLGYIRPLVELVDGKTKVVDETNFCVTMKVFIAKHYDELERRFPEKRIFEITVRLNDRLTDKVAPEQICKYIAADSDAIQLKPKDYFEVMAAPLPDANNKLVSLSNFPGVPYIFVEDGDFLYGPFKWTHAPNNDDETLCRLDFVDAPLPGVKLIDYQVYKTKKETIKNVFHIKDEGVARTFFHGTPTFTQSEFYDYASDAEVARYCARLAKENNIKIDNKQISNLVTFLKQKPKFETATLVKTRLARLTEANKEVGEIQTEVTEGFASYLSSEPGKEIVSEYINANASQYLDKLKDDKENELNLLLKDKLKQVEDAAARLKELNDNKISLSIEIESLAEKSKKEINLESAYAEADAKMQKLQAQISELQKTADEKAAIVDGILNIESIEQKLEVAKSRERSEWKNQESIRTTTAELQSLLHSGEESLRKELTKLKPFVEAINGTFNIDEVQTGDLYIQPKDYNSTEPTVVKQRAVINEVQIALAAKGREMEDWQVANLLISTQQSFITFMAGFPGVGKTSLARLIPAVQNINPRLLEISVARGWTSQKDLVGFFNPLSSRFQPSNTGMYKFLLSLKEEAGQQNVMSYILLDEANLSPIEHYWSSFMGMTDGEGNQGLLLGQEQVKIPKSCRFIATINYDGTTEPLSPRVVDRAPILVLETQSLGSFAQPIGSLSKDSILPISDDRMNELFGNNEKFIPDLEEPEKTVFAKIKSVLSNTDPTLGRPISISPRKEIFIRQYCGKARGIMNSERAFLALDVAVLQHILPLIRGSGNRFGKRLEALKRELDTVELQLSSSYLARMIAFGESDLHTYDFFCW